MIQQMNEMINQDFVDYFQQNDQFYLVKKENKFIRNEISYQKFLDDQQIESSIRNVGSLGVIPRAKIKTVKMTLVIVIG